MHPKHSKQNIALVALNHFLKRKLQKRLFISLSLIETLSDNWQLSEKSFFTETFIYLRYFLRNMLTENIRKELMENIKKNPKEIRKILEDDPKMFEMLLSEVQKVKDEANQERQEKIKYINMTNQMETQLREQAQKLQTTQGVLIGVGILWLLSQLDKD